MVVTTDDKNTFTTNLNRAKELCLKLDKEIDKKTVNKWIENFQGVYYYDKDPKLCNHYLGLLLLSLKYNILIYPFDQMPPNDNNLKALLLPLALSQKNCSSIFRQHQKNPADGPNNKSLKSRESFYKHLLSLDNFVPLSNIKLITAPVHQQSRLRPPSQIRPRSDIPRPAINTTPPSSKLPTSSNVSTSHRTMIPGISPSSPSTNQENANTSILTDDEMSYDDVFGETSVASEAEMEELRHSILFTNEKKLAQNLHDSILVMNSVGKLANKVLPSATSTVSPPAKNVEDVGIVQDNIELRKEIRLTNEIKLVQNLEDSIGEMNSLGEDKNLVLMKTTDGNDQTIGSPNQENVVAQSEIIEEASSKISPGLSLDIGPNVSTSPIIRLENTNSPNQPSNPFITPINSTEVLQSLVSDMADPTTVNQRIMEMPKHLRERLSRKFVSKIKQKYPGRDENVMRTPPMFRKGYEGITVHRFKPQDFGLSRHERFIPATEFFADAVESPQRKKQRNEATPKKSNKRQQIQIPPPSRTQHKPSTAWPDGPKRKDAQELLYVPPVTKEERAKKRRYERMLQERIDANQTMEELYKRYPIEDFLSSPTNVQSKRRNINPATPTTTNDVITIDKSSSDSEFDPFVLEYSRELDPEGIKREYAKDYKKYRKQHKSARESFISDEYAKTKAIIAAEEAAEAEATAAAAATQSNQGAEIIEQYQIPKIPDNYVPPMDKSYKPVSRLIYTELPADQPSPQTTLDESILKEDEMYTDDIFGEDQIEEIKTNLDESILKEDEMYTDDIFGEDQIEDIERDLIKFRTPSPSSSDEILNEDEMMVDDVFGEGQVAGIDVLPIQKPAEASEVVDLVEEEIKPESPEGRYLTFLRECKLESLRQKIISPKEQIEDFNEALNAAKARQEEFFKRTLTPATETVESPKIVEIQAEPVAPTTADEEHRQIQEKLKINQALRKQAERKKTLAHNRKIAEMKDQFDDKELRSKLISKDGDETRYQLTKSAIASQQYQDIVKRYNEAMNLPANDNQTYDLTDKDKYPAYHNLENPDLMYPHAPVLKDHEEPYTMWDKPLAVIFNESPLKPEKITPEYLKPFFEKLKLVDDDHAKQMQKIKDKIYKQNLTISSSEEIIPIVGDLLHDVMSSPKKAYHPKLKPGILDESLTEDKLHPALVKEPENFVRDIGLLDEEQMQVDDIFGENQIADPRTVFKAADFSSDSSSLQIQSESMIASRKAYEALQQLKAKLKAIRPLAVHNEDVIDRIQELEDKIKQLEPIASKHKIPKKRIKRQTPIKLIHPTPGLDAAGRPRPVLNISPTSRIRLLEPMTEADYIEFERQKREAGVVRPSLSLSPKSRILELIKQAEKFETTSKRDPVTGRLIFTSRRKERSPSPPPPLPDPNIDDEYIELISSDEEEMRKDGVVVHSPTHRPLYIPSTSSSSEDGESPIAVAVTPVHATRDFAPDTSPIGKTWVDRNERGFAWLQEMVPMMSGPYIRRRRVLQFNTVPSESDEPKLPISVPLPTKPSEPNEPKLSITVPSPAKQSPPKRKKKRVRTTCEVLDSTLTEVIFISPRPNRGEEKRVPAIKAKKPYILTDEQVMERARKRDEARIKHKASEPPLFTGSDDEENRALIQAQQRAHILQSAKKSTPMADDRARIQKANKEIEALNKQKTINKERELMEKVNQALAEAEALQKTQALQLAKEAEAQIKQKQLNEKRALDESIAQAQAQQQAQQALQSARVANEIEAQIKQKQLNEKRALDESIAQAKAQQQVQDLQTARVANEIEAQIKQKQLNEKRALDERAVQAAQAQQQVQDLQTAREATKTGAIKKNTKADRKMERARLRKEAQEQQQILEMDITSPSQLIRQKYTDEQLMQMKKLQEQHELQMKVLRDRARQQELSLQSPVKRDQYNAEQQTLEETDITSPSQLIRQKYTDEQLMQMKKLQEQNELQMKALRDRARQQELSLQSPVKLDQYNAEQQTLEETDITSPSQLIRQKYTDEQLMEMKKLKEEAKVQLKAIRDRAQQQLLSLQSPEVKPNQYNTKQLMDLAKLEVKAIDQYKTLKAKVRQEEWLSNLNVS